MENLGTSGGDPRRRSVVAVRRSSTAARRRLGTELRRLRDAAGMTIEQVAESLECSVSKISRIETGQVGATARDVRDMLEIYGVTGKQQEPLIKVAKEARERGWWHRYGNVAISAHLSFEAAASTFRIYEAALVPGLLQTAEYAAAVIRALHPDMPSNQLKQALDLRLERQRVLQQPYAPTLWAILDESIVRRPVGGKQVMRDQLIHLASAAEDPNVTLQVLAFSAAEHAGMDGAFTILGFPDPADPDIVYRDHATSALLLEGAEELRRYALLFDHLRATALKPIDSIAFLKDLIDE